MCQVKQACRAEKRDVCNYLRRQCACTSCAAETGKQSGAQISRGELSEDEMKQRRERSMADPEIQGILTDPVMTQVLPGSCACAA